MQAREIMTSSVITVSPQTSLALAQRLMHDHRIRHLPVVSAEQLVGIVTDRDLRNALPSSATTLTQAEMTYHMGTTHIATCMTKAVVTLRPEEDMIQGTRRLLDGPFGCLPVVEGSQLVGLVTAVDLLRGFLMATAPTANLMRVNDYMHRNPATGLQDERVSTAYQRMQEAHIRHLPIVMEGHKLVGIITDRDMRQAGASTTPSMAAYDITSLLEKMTVKEIMSTRLHTVQGETTVADAGQLFLDYKVGCLPVIHDDSTLAGILTMSDLLRAYVESCPG